MARDGFNGDIRARQRAIWEAEGRSPNEDFYEAMPATATSRFMSARRVDVDEMPVREVIRERPVASGSRLSYLLLGLIIGGLVGVAAAVVYNLHPASRSSNTQAPAETTGPQF